MTDLSADKSSEDDDSLESFSYDLDDIEDEDDDDIDIDYDWNANKTVPIKEEKEPLSNEPDDGDDDDIDVDYDWNVNKSTKKKEIIKPIDVDQKIDYEDSFNLDSPHFLDTPLYSKTPTVSTHFQQGKSLEIENILNLNTTMNKYQNEDSLTVSQLTVTETGDQSPVSTMSAMSAVSELTPAAVSQDGSQLFAFAVAALKLRPSHSARTMNVISEAIDEKESGNDINYIKQIDSLLATYYVQHHQEGYVNADGTGKFMAYCAANSISNDDIYNYLTAELTDCTYLYFDATFPLRLSIDINGDHIDSNTELQLKQMEIYTVIKYCFDNKKAPD